MKTTIDNKAYYPSIDGLRALAVLAVILFHLEVPYFNGGYIGVDLFFVISGFLITEKIQSSLHNGTFSFRTFYVARIRRLFPALLTTVIVTVLLSTFIYSAEHLRQIANSALAAIFSYSNLFFWNITGYFDSSANTKPLLHFWSLSVEEQFYLLWPITFALAFKNPLCRANIAQLIIILTVIAITVSHFTTEVRPSSAFFLTQYRSFEFLLGALGVFIQPKKQSLLTTKIFITVSLTTIIAAIVVFDELTPSPGFYSLLPCTAALILILNRNSPLNNLLLGSAPVVFIGKISYSLYLVHWPIWALYSYWKYDIITSTEKLLLLLIIFVFGYSLYKLIENRFRYVDLAKQKNNWRFSTKVILTYALITSLCLSIVYGKGWSWRYTTDNIALESKIKEDNQCISAKTTNRNNAQINCTYGDITSPTKHVLVLGDSHAEALSYGLALIGIDHRIKFDSKTFLGCPPIWNAYKIYDIKQKKEPLRQINCRKQIQNWQNYVANTATDYDAIILISRWGWLTESSRYGDSYVRSDSIAIAGDTSFPKTVSSRRNLLKKLLGETVVEIQKQGIKKVIIISQPPLLGKSIQNCNEVPRALYSRQRIIQRCDHGVANKNVLSRVQNVNKVITSTESFGAMTILPSDYLCDPLNGKCLVMNNNRLLYDDSNHLSIAGSLLLADRFKDSLVSLIKEI